MFLKVRKSRLECIAIFAASASLFLFCEVSASEVFAKKPLHESSFKEILKKYTFVNDFSIKPEARNVSEEIFWKYPLTIPKLDFEIENQFDSREVEMPATQGGGMETTHLNRGRILFYDKEYERAKATWLSGKTRYGKDYKHFRRNDYFIGLAFMRLAKEAWEAKNNDWNDDLVKNHFSNATTFASWALLTNRLPPDPLLDQVTPKSLYNLAAIYWTYNRFAAAYGAAAKGLEFLRKTGRKDYRPQFNRILAEAFVKNRTFLEAIQHFDTAIRQDPDPRQAAAMFTRVGDIYYDLNNYELSEDAYALAARIDFESEIINPAQMVLRGESLFWLGRFSDSQKVLAFALEGTTVKDSTRLLSKKMQAYATLRLADGYLARGKIEKARLAYFNVAHEFKGTGADDVAKVRSACLELPYYGGNNVSHARKLLEEAKTAVYLPPAGKEMAWACQVSSFTDRERSGEMLKRVSEFAAEYPNSGFLKSMAAPVIQVQATKINDYFKKNEIYKAISFYEKTKDKLFENVSDDVAAKLFNAYVDIHQSEKAAEFSAFAPNSSDSDVQLIRNLVFASEMGSKLKSKRWVNYNKDKAITASKKKWTVLPEAKIKNFLLRIGASDNANTHYPWIYNLASSWSGKSNEHLCSYQYPILSKLFDRKIKDRKWVKGELDRMMAQSMPHLLRLDESCAVSLLDLEASLYSTDSKKLASIYQSRGEWPMQGAYLKNYWTLSEKLAAKGEKELSRTLWKEITEKGPAGAPEVDFAKARLDPRKTEVEKLW